MDACSCGACAHGAWAHVRVRICHGVCAFAMTRACIREWSMVDVPGVLPMGMHV